MTRFPGNLNKGDTIGLVCPSGYLPYEKAHGCIRTLKEWGYGVRIGKTVGKQMNYFSGTDEERMLDLQNMMDDDNVHAILCARGGYGLGRIIDFLNFKRFLKSPKWIIGFSDITILHCHLYSNYKIASLHAPMAVAFNDGENNEYINSLKDTLAGQSQNYTCKAHPFNQNGIARGILIGGNLTLINHVIDTISDINTKNKILFLEDIGEYIYNIDRMFYQLKRAGRLENLSGLIIGGFTDIKDTTIPFGQTAEEVIKAIVKEYKYPVCFGFPISHSKENYTLKIGSQYEMSVTNTITILKEI